MRPFHVLAAALSLGGTIAAVSATQAAAFDPVQLAGPMGEPGSAVSVPCEALLVTSPRPCTKIIAVRGGERPLAAELLDETALDPSAARVRDEPSDTARPRQFLIRVSQDIYRIYGARSRLASAASAGSAAAETVLDLNRD